MKVYIEAEVCSEGPKKDFKYDQYLNPSKPIMKEFDAFLQSDKSVFLLSGMAGSGKSTATEKMKLHVLTAYASERRRKGKTVLLVPVSLPTLRDPLGTVFEEGCKMTFSMSDDQVHTLLEDIQAKDSQYEVIGAELCYAVIFM